MKRTNPLSINRVMQMYHSEVEKHLKMATIKLDYARSEYDRTCEYWGTVKSLAPFLIAKNADIDLLKEELKTCNNKYMKDYLTEAIGLLNK